MCTISSTPHTPAPPTKREKHKNKNQKIKTEISFFIKKKESGGNRCCFLVGPSSHDRPYKFIPSVDAAMTAIKEKRSRHERNNGSVP